MTKIEKKEYNVWNQVKKQLCIAYLEAGEKPDFETSFRFMDDFTFTTQDGKTVTIEGAGKVLYVLKRDGAIQATETTEVSEVVDGKIKKVYLVKIKGFNENAKAKSKTGKMYDIFSVAMQKALYSLRKSK